MSKWRTSGASCMIALSLFAASCREKAEERTEAAAAAEKPAAPTVPAPPVPITEEKPGLMAKAKVQPEQARNIALAKVPGGTITKGELEEEEGKLIYSFDISVPGQQGITELHVDALTGEIIKTEHETAGQPEAAAGKEKKGK